MAAIRRWITVSSVVLLVVLGFRLLHQSDSLSHTLPPAPKASEIPQASTLPYRAAQADSVAWHPDAADILEVLKSWAASNRIVHFMNPIGNAGDALITYATYQMFDRAGITAHPLTDKRLSNVTSWKGSTNPPERVFDIVVLGGGGNFMPRYNFISRRIITLSQISNLVALFPHTIRGHENILQQLGPNVVLYCRDVPSYQHVINHATGGAKVEFAYDMATHMQLPDAILRIKPTRGTLHAFREDIEKTAVEIPSDNIDVSRQRLIRAGADFEESEKIAHAMLKTIARYSAIMTNRLHVVIGSWLLNRPVLAYDNDYGKVRDLVLGTPVLSSSPLITHHFDDDTVDLVWPHA